MGRGGAGRSWDKGLQTPLAGKLPLTPETSNQPGKPSVQCEPDSDRPCGSHHLVWKEDAWKPHHGSGDPRRGRRFNCSVPQSPQPEDVTLLGYFGGLEHPIHGWGAGQTHSRSSVNTSPGALITSHLRLLTHSFDKCSLGTAGVAGTQSPCAPFSRLSVSDTSVPAHSGSWPKQHSYMPLQALQSRRAPV